MGRQDRFNKYLAEAATEAPKVEERPPVEKPKIPFDHWYWKLQKAGLIQPYLRNALLVFIKKQGLTQMEDEDKYNEVFKKF